MGEGDFDFEITPKEEWTYPPPKSVTEILFNRVCEEHQ